MDLCFDDDQQAYRTAVRQFADEVLTPIAREKYDFRHPLTRKDMQEIAADVAKYEIATVTPTTPEGGIDLIYLAIFIEEIARIDFGFASLANAMFFQVWDMGSLLRTEEQQRRYGFMFGRGEMTAIALSEPEAASNPADMNTKARKVENGWLINGRKLWTSHDTVASGHLFGAKKETDCED
jgi:alkylation response protein AidB-like acyl-CoA dehydrogenase